jgi:hypothetical protein
MLKLRHFEVRNFGSDRNTNDDGLYYTDTCSGISHQINTALAELPALKVNVAWARNTGLPEGYACPAGTIYYSSGYGACSNSIGSCWASKTVHPSNRSSDGYDLMDGKSFGWLGWWVACPHKISGTEQQEDKVRFRYVTDKGDTVNEGITRLGLINNSGDAQFYGIPALLTDSYGKSNAKYQNFSYENGYIHICKNFDSDCVMNSDDRVLTLRINKKSLDKRDEGLRQTDLAKKIIDQGIYHSNQGKGCYVDFNEANSPLVLDIGEGIQLSDPRIRSVKFDLEGLGVKETVSCLEKGAYLALPTGGRVVNNIHQLFGNNTRGPDGKTAANGFEALAKYDSNRDGIIDSRDAVYSQLRLWQDVNCNGSAEATELSTLAASNVRSIDLDYVDALQIDAYGNQTRERSVYEKMNGALGLIVDIWLAPLK